MIALLGLWLAAADPTPPLPTVVSPVPEPQETIWTVPIVHSLGLLAGMRLSLSILWPEPYNPLPFSRSTRQFGAAYDSPPELRNNRWLLESDGDPWVINVVGHGLFGAEVYGRVRQCGGGVWQALAFTAGTSVVWEYGVESFNKRPSAIDLVATPLIGAALGEARYRAQRWLRRRERGFWRRFGEVVIDPLGEGERVILGTRC
jgi:Domain of unknown function (DUF3943)